LIERLAFANCGAGTCYVLSRQLLSDRKNYPSEGAALYEITQSLSRFDQREPPEISRSDKRTRALTSEQVRKDLELMVGMLPGKDKRAARSRAILTFSALVGAMSLARAVSDEGLSREILKTVADLLKNPS
jgi:hypothetical protein